MMAQVDEGATGNNTTATSPPESHSYTHSRIRTLLDKIPRHLQAGIAAPPGGWGAESDDEHEEDVESEGEEEALESENEDENENNGNEETEGLSGEYEVYVIVNHRRVGRGLLFQIHWAGCDNPVEYTMELESRLRITAGSEVLKLIDNYKIAHGL